MTLGKQIEAAVTPIVPICVPKQYGGDATEYCTYNYTEVPDLFGDDEPGVIRCRVQVHWLYPWAPNASEAAEALQKKRQLRQALGETFESWPTVTPAGDGEWEHFVFEFDALEEV